MNIYMYQAAGFEAQVSVLRLTLTNLTSNKANNQETMKSKCFRTNRKQPAWFSDKILAAQYSSVPLEDSVLPPAQVNSLISTRHSVLVRQSQSKPNFLLIIQPIKRSCYVLRVGQFKKKLKKITRKSKHKPIKCSICKISMKWVKILTTRACPIP